MRTTLGRALRGGESHKRCLQKGVEDHSGQSMLRGGNSMALPTQKSTKLAWPGLAWPGLAWPGLAWPGLAWPGLTWRPLLAHRWLCWRGAPTAAAAAPRRAPNGTRAGCAADLARFSSLARSMPMVSAQLGVGGC
jgi:hypothetical protein